MGVKDNIQDYMFFLSVDIKKHLQNVFKLSSLLICVKHIWEMFQFLLFGIKEEASGFIAAALRPWKTVVLLLAMNIY